MERGLRTTDHGKLTNGPWTSDDELRQRKDHSLMEKTERLYYADCYLRGFEARVLSKDRGPKGFRVVLDRTAFYPESGGQPMDRGTLGGIPVLEVVEDGETIVHVLEHPLEGDVVKGEVDWARRFDHMQQHTGQHILSAAFEKTGNYKTISFHLGRDSSSIDLDSDRLGLRQIEEAEELANRVVFENREVRLFFRPAAEAGTMDLRKPTERKGDVRLVEVKEFDLSACGGTHVSRSGAIGLIVARKFERMKGQTRVEFICGSRALKAARQDFRLLSEAAGAFSASAENVPALVAKQSEELRAALHAHEKLVERLAEHQARELWQGAPERNGRRVVCHIFAAEVRANAKTVAHVIAKQPSSVALIGVKGHPATLYFTQSAGGPSDMASLLKQAVAKFGGKGGGTRDFAQGGGLAEDKLQDVLTFVGSQL